MRRSRLVAWCALALAPIPICAALIATGLPSYHGDACFYGASAAERQATHDYLELLAPLGMFGFAAAVSVVVWIYLPRWWKLVAAAVFVWAATTILWQQASHPVMYPGGLLALFGIFLGPLAVTFTVIAGRDKSWLRAVAWFEALYLMPSLLGLGKLLAQPACIP